MLMLSDRKKQNALLKMGQWVSELNSTVVYILWSEIHQALLSQCTRLGELLIEKVPIKGQDNTVIAGES